MKQKYFIPFNKIPEGFKAWEPLRVISFEFSGIQSFIFDSVDTESTPDEIRLRSQYVIFATQKVLERLSTLLQKKNKLRILSMSSGKLMVAVSKGTKEAVLIEICNNIQRTIYAETRGQLQAYYAILEARVTESPLPKKGKDALGMLRLLINQNKYLCKNLIGFSFSEYADTEFSFADFERKNRKCSADNDTFFASLKLDFDNLGDFFGNVTQLDVRKKTSIALASVIENAVAITEGAYPIFVGGDDIFILLKDCNYPKVINALYRNLRDGIEKTEELSLYRPIFGISGGMSIIRNDLGKVPLFYYSELAEEQLEIAKATKNKNSISINETVLSWDQIFALAEITEHHMDKILDGMDENRRLIILSNPGELKNRILRLIKSKAIEKGKGVAHIESI